MAHQPRLVGEKTEINVADPEISKAYYGKLAGTPAIYHISTTVPFNLYVNVLVPRVSSATKDISARILQDGSEIAVLDGSNYNWEEFYEPYGGDYYYRGPEFKKSVEAGNYTIEVYSSSNVGPYSLAIGEKESFPVSEIAKTILILPILKYKYFDASIAQIVFGRAGLIYGILLVILIIVLFLIVKLSRRF